MSASGRARKYVLPDSQRASGSRYVLALSFRVRPRPAVRVACQLRSLLDNVGSLIRGPRKVENIASALTPGGGCAEVVSSSFDPLCAG
jgi:hypothetical protein